MKPSKRFFLIALAALAALLLVFGGLRMAIGPFLPEVIDANLPDAIIVAAIAILLWNRKLRNDQEKADAAEAERRGLEEAAALEGGAGAEEAEKEDAGAD